MKTSFLVPLLAAAYASAHGYVESMTIDGQQYQGDKINGPDNPSIIRQVNAQDPIYGATNANINCGNGATIAAQMGNANPGSQLTFNWVTESGSPWPHDTGPILTYMASCGDADCSQFDSTKAQWFKIQEIGRRADGLWTQKNIMEGAPANVTIPTTLAPGNYLIRNEIIALHLAITYQKAEFYESCSQVTVGGNQNGGPTQDELVSLPGAYSDNDPGILVNAYDPSVPYVFPGPPIAAFVAGTPGAAPSPGADSGSSGKGNSPAPAPTSGSTGKGNSGTSAASTSGSNGGSCHLKKKISSTAAGASATGSAYKPRHLSRVMRDLVFGNSKFH